MFLCDKARVRTMKIECVKDMFVPFHAYFSSSPWSQRGGGVLGTSIGNFFQLIILIGFGILLIEEYCSFQIGLGVFASTIEVLKWWILERWCSFFVILILCWWSSCLFFREQCQLMHNLMNIYDMPKIFLRLYFSCYAYSRYGKQQN